MTEQLDMFGGSAALERSPLTERQAFALDEITKADGGLASDELGAVLHERRGSHERGVRCHFCSTEGREVGRRLKGLGFVVLKAGVNRAPGEIEARALVTDGTQVPYAHLGERNLLDRPARDPKSRIGLKLQQRAQRLTSLAARPSLEHHVDSPVG